MTNIEIIFIAVGLAMDAFAVSFAAATSGRIKGKRASFRLSFHFGLFQFLMPIIGWASGYYVAEYIKAVDHWIAFILLAIIGMKMIKESFEAEDDDSGKSTDPSKGANLVLLSVATSIDAFAIGLTLAMLNVEILYPSIAIGIITAFLSLVAILAGKKIGAIIGKRMETVGGVILILIGLKVLIEHLFFP